MKKSLLILAAICLLISESQAQEKTKMRPSDRIIVSVFTDFWSDLPQDMETFVINRGIGFDYIQEFPLSTSNFSVAAGLGFSSHNLYSNHTYNWDTDRYSFTQIPDNQNYSNNKISLNYINVPVEFRFRTRDASRTFRIHAGIRGGLLISAHTKYKGEDAPEGREIKIKEKSLDNIERLLIGVHGRIGYGRVNLNAYMSLNDIFTGNNAEGSGFMSLGLSFILF